MKLPRSSRFALDKTRKIVLRRTFAAAFAGVVACWAIALPFTSAQNKIALAESDVKSVESSDDLRAGGSLTTPVADYQFLSSRASQDNYDLGQAQNAVDIGAGNAFAADQIVFGTPRAVLDFPQGNGIEISNNTATGAGTIIASDQYSISIVFRLQNTDGYRRLIDFKNGASDNGLYVLNNRLVFYLDGALGNAVNTPILPNVWTHVVVTRDANNSFAAFVNGVEQFRFDDTSGQAIIGAANALRFFKDDGGEQSAGSIARVALYNTAFGANNARALPKLAAENCLARPANLVAWFAADGNARNLQNASGSAVLNNNANFNDGISGQAFDFDGTNQNATAPATNLPTGNAARTIELWFKPDAASLAPGNALFLYGAPQTQGFFGVDLDTVSADNTVRLRIFNDNSGSFASIDTNAAPDDFIHLAVVLNSSTNTLFVYANGTSVAAISSYTLNTATSSTLEIGSANAAFANSYFGGLIDELKFYNRALSAAEVQRIYTAANAGTCKGAATFTTFSTADGGAGTLRQAIFDANQNPGDDTIAFNFGSSRPNGISYYNIGLTSNLPSVTSPIVFDGYTQPNSAVNDAAQGTTANIQVRVNGDAVSFGQSGLRFSGAASSNSAVRGLSLVGFGFAAILTEGASNVQIEGNFIGVSPDGSAFPNDDCGVYFSNSASLDAGNRIGGAALWQRNLISANGNAQTSLGDGVLLESTSEGGVPSTKHIIQNNLIGVQRDGVGALPNVRDGIRVETAGNLIGAATPGAAGGNVIAFNGGNGISVIGRSFGSERSGEFPGFGGVTANRIATNSIYGNTRLGIDLGNNGATANDDGDASGGIAPDEDGGANNQQNYPVVNFAGSGSTRIIGSLISTPNSNFVVEFFNSPVGGSQGRTFIGAISVATNSDGKVAAANIIVGTGTIAVRSNNNFDVRFTNFTALVGSVITSTATDSATNDTSEFSAPQTVIDNTTAAAVAVGGTITTANGRAIKNARVVLTDQNGATRVAFSNAFGRYRFADVTAGQSIVISAAAKGYQFAAHAQPVNVGEQNNDINFVALK